MSDPEIKALPTPEDWTEFFQSRFLHAADLKGQNRTYKIAGSVMELLPDEKHPGQEKMLGSLRFEGEKKLLGLQRTLATCLKQMWGPKVADWVGKRITLFPTTVRMPDPVSKKMVDAPCIRIFGSPDIAADITFDLQLPRKKPQSVRLQRMVPKQ